MRNIAAVMVAAALAAFGPMAAPAGAQDIGFATGRQGGYQYPISVAIAQVVEKTPGFGRVTLQPGGGTGNVLAVGLGKAELGITLSQDTRAGIEGLAPFKQKMPQVVQLFALNPSKVAILVRDDSPIREFKDLAGKRVNSGPVGFSITTLSRRIYAMTGLDKSVRQSHLQVGDAVEQFKDGHLDALFYAPSDWYGPYIDLAASRKIRLVPLPASVMDALIAEEPSFYKARFPIKPGIYKNLINEVETIGYPTIVIANAQKFDDARAYAIVKAVAENWEQVKASEPSLRLMEPKDIALQAGVPVHAGAMRYFRERGWAN